MTFRRFRSRHARSQQAGIAALVRLAQEQASARGQERQREAGATTEVLPVPLTSTIPLVQVIPTSPAPPAVPLQWSARLRPWRRAALRERRDMSGFGVYSCGSMLPVLSLPDAGPCCDGSASMGPQRCTCWEPVYDAAQAEPVQGNLGMRTRMCRDCAYRAGSPEKRGEAGYKGDGESLDEMVTSGEMFACHQGLRRVVKYVHPSGAEVPAHPADYAPAFVGGLPYKADGSPGDLCAGWAARRLNHLWREKETAETSR